MKNLIYTEAIEPLLIQVKELCEKHGIQMAAAFAYETGDNVGEFISLCCIDKNHPVPPQLTLIQSILTADTEDSTDSFPAELIEMVTKQGAPAAVTMVKVDAAALADTLLNKTLTELMEGIAPNPDCDCHLCREKRAKAATLHTNPNTRH